MFRRDGFSVAIGGLVIAWVLLSTEVALLSGWFMAAAHRKKRRPERRAAPGQQTSGRIAHHRAGRNRASRYLRNRLRGPGATPGRRH
ncbi:MAG: hypothetical protein M3069_07870 [Chloroflexota bacterium]|nr:hypothetical protein [Chloroflexota bacterium]